MRQLPVVGPAGPAPAETPGSRASAAVPTAAASPMVYGVRKSIAKAGIWGRILNIAVRTYGTLGAAAVLRRMLAERARVQTWKTRKYACAGGRYFWNLYSPGWPSPAFDRYIERELDRLEPSRVAQPALQTAVLAMTKRCAYQCEHCCEWDVLNSPEALSGADLQRIVQRLQERGVSQLFLSGGEPLRRFNELVQVVKQSASEADVWILTSGRGLSRQRAERLRAAGLTGVALSLDHWEPAGHDRFRGVPGAFRSVEAAAANAREAGLLVALSLCPTRAFISEHNLERYAMTARLLGAGFIQILEPKAIGRYADMDVTLSADQQRLLEAFCDCLNTDPRHLDLPSVAYPDYARRRSGCFGAGDRHLYVDTDGSLHPCPFCRISVAHALDGDFEGALERMRASGCRAAE